MSVIARRYRHRCLSYSFCVFLRRFLSQSKCRLNLPTSSFMVTTESKIDKSVAEKLEAQNKEFISYKRHDGLFRYPKSQLPSPLLKAMKNVFDDNPISSIEELSGNLFQQIIKREPLATDEELNKKAQKIEQDILEKKASKMDKDISEMSESEIEKHRKAVLSKMRKTTYHWKQFVFDASSSLVYLHSRMAFDYSVIMQCFYEISQKDKTFSPKYVYHYGSKVGAGVWAANKMWNGITEHYCVDQNNDMNNLSKLLMQGGNEKKSHMNVRDVYFRSFEPSPKENKFSLVVSPFMLIEQPTARDREDLVQNMWEMTESYLILIENGTSAGFKLINEARNTLLNLTQTDKKDLQGHVFAPCQHDLPCPKMAEKKIKPCISDSLFHSVEGINPNEQYKIKTGKYQRAPLKFVRFSYLIMKKGQKKKEGAWPRVVGHIKAHNHTHCHLCLPSGKLQHVIISKKKYEKHLYGCAKYCSPGDQLPVLLNGDCPEDSDSVDDSELTVSEGVLNRAINVE